MKDEYYVLVLYHMKHIILYSTPTCGYCKMAKAFFRDNNIAFEEKDVAENSENAEEMFQKSGAMGVPVMDIEGEVIIGFDREKLKDVLGTRDG